MIPMRHADSETPTREPIPVIVIGGFLGSGKTTLLNYILSENHGVRVGVLVNDFGAINIDAKLVVGVDGDLVSLSNGCVCCSIRDDLIPACMALVRRDDPPELLIVETSGISEPFNVANTFMLPELESIMPLDNVVTVVDAEQFPGLLENDWASLARTQLRDADMIVLNKVDLVSEKELAEVKTLVHNIAPRSRVLEANYGRVSLDLLQGGQIRKADVLGSSASGGPVEHAHDHPFSTWYWTGDQPLSLPGLRSVIEALPDTVYRAKGIVYLEELPSHQIVLQMVGKRYEIGDTAPWGAQQPRSEVVVIGSQNGFDREALQRAFDDCIGRGDESMSPILRLNRFLAAD